MSVLHVLGVVDVMDRGEGWLIAIVGHHHCGVSGHEAETKAE
jgi:hypothetical protein